MIAGLAALPSAEVDLIIPALQQARRDAIEADKALRRERREDRKRYRHHDEDDLTQMLLRQLAATGRRAGTNLDALSGLGAFAKAIDALTASAVADLRERGISDPVIADALGISRQAVGQRFGRKGATAAQEALGELEVPAAGGPDGEAAGVNDPSPATMSRALAEEIVGARRPPLHRYDLERADGNPLHYTEAELAEGTGTGPWGGEQRD
jgi:hypothetical protein